MIFSENSDQAVVYLRKAVPKMMQHNIIPNPFNFTLWYAYYSKRFPNLNDELDSVIDDFGTCPANISEKLFLKYIIDSDAEIDSIKELFQQSVVNIVDNLAESIDQTSRQSQNFSAALNQSIVSLADSELGPEVSGLLNKISASASGLCDLNTAFQGEMSEAQQEIQSLKKQLVESQLQANTDSLTGLNNRRVFDALFRQLLEADNQSEISLIMMDIDKFKVFNDTHGHLMGDQVLKFVGKLLKAECPAPIVPVRFGGEEFALLCPGMDLDKTREVAEDLRTKLSRIGLSNKRTGEKLPPVTASFGISISRSNEMLHHLIERADQALYTAKENGRNRVHVAL
ncbi:MAG: GGDEF domain-containing protein [Oceanospirillaceae bacterium]|nr:GGDEF domain-containing protein [Oceanospirillaceae bacterium]